MNNCNTLYFQNEWFLKIQMQNWDFIVSYERNFFIFEYNVIFTSKKKGINYVYAWNVL